jgi:hypothetical protein
MTPTVALFAFGIVPALLAMVPYLLASDFALKFTYGIAVTLTHVPAWSYEQNRQVELPAHAFLFGMSCVILLAMLAACLIAWDAALIAITGYNG